MDGRLYLSFYGREETLRELKKDLERLGINADLYVRGRNYGIETTSGSYGAAELRVTSRAFALLMEKLGMPRGRKTEKAYGVPGWIKDAPLWVKRNFLAGLFAADGSIAEFKGTTPLPINLTQSKAKELEENLVEFMKEIGELLAEFGIRTTLYRVRSRKGVTYRLALVGEESIRNFLGRVNYEYDLEKKAKGLVAYAYLKFKERVKGGERRNAAETASFVERAVYEGPKEPRVPEDFPTFEEFARERGATRAASWPSGSLGSRKSSQATTGSTTSGFTTGPTTSSPTG